MELLQRRFTFPEKCNISTAVIRETNGIDEQQAALAASVAGDATTVYAELIRLAIMEVDDQKIMQPFVQLETFNTATRQMIRMAYDELNEIPDEGKATFLTASEDVTPGLAVKTGAEEESTETTEG